MATSPRFRAPAPASASTTAGRIIVFASASNIDEQAVPTKRGENPGHGVNAKLPNTMEVVGPN